MSNTTLKLYIIHSAQPSKSPSAMSYHRDYTVCEFTTPFEKAFHCADVYDRINSMIPPHSSVMLSWTCHATNNARASFTRCTFNINHHLRRFFQNPLEFRTIQAETGTIISGSSALQFFNREIFEDSDLDLYLHPGHLERIGAWLMKSEGYIYITEDPNVPVTEQQTLHGFQAFKTASMLIDRPILHPSPVFSPDIHHPGLEVPSSPSVPYFPADVIKGCMTFVCNMGSHDQRLVQLMVTEYNLLDAILQFHSSE